MKNPVSEFLLWHCWGVRDNDTQHKISRNVEGRMHLRKREKEHQDRGSKAAGLQATPTGTKLQQAGYFW